MATYISTNWSWPKFDTNPTSAQLQAWVSRTLDALSAAGLVQTADTGQVNPTGTLTWPAAGVDFGYAIFRFNDALQGADPLFIRITFGKGSGSQNNPRMVLSVGQGSNGSGTLTGAVAGPLLVCHPFTANSTAGSDYQLLASAAEGHACLVTFTGSTSLKVNGAGGWFSIERSRDPSSGAFDGRGVSILNKASAFSASELRFLRFTPTTFDGLAAEACIVPALPASTSLLNGDKQLYPHFYAAPEVRQRWSTFTVRQSEFAALATSFSATPVTSLGARTFINIGVPSDTGIGAICNGTDNTSFCACFLWE
jgi:hypothetical protein